MEGYMKRQTGSPQLYLASSVTEQARAASSEQRLQSIVTTLAECQAALVASGNRETAQLVSVAILQLRMKHNRIADADLKALCDAIVLADAPVRESQRSKSQQGQRRRPAALLKLVD
jgi:signal transduction histidine kinase